MTWDAGLDDPAYPTLTLRLTCLTPLADHDTLRRLILIVTLGCDSLQRILRRRPSQPRSRQRG